MGQVEIILNVRLPTAPFVTAVDEPSKAHRMHQEFKNSIHIKIGTRTRSPFQMITPSMAVTKINSRLRTD